MPRKNHIDVITMGCSKNLVDSERLIGILASKGYTASHDPELPEGDYVVVNTCGFIGDAKEESINMILELSQLKKEKKIGQLIVMGCLSQRYKEELPGALPEVDRWYGKFDWKGFTDSLPDITESQEGSLNQFTRQLTTPKWTAYVKVSEGCDRLCAFCAIPYITGRHVSRPIEEILEEVTELAKSGVKEINVIAQDLSSYGLDLYKEQKLPELIDRIAGIHGIEWIRLHYLYPAGFPLELLEVMARHDNVCRYLDIALQHISDPVLANMNRKITSDETLTLLKTIREKIPGIHIRTTLMTGFPGEGDNEFQELLDFIDNQRFERLGAFAYCEEEGTLGAEKFKDCIPPEVKEERLDELMELQQQIALELNEEKIGQVLKILIERHEGADAVGRTEFDSPEVDNEVIVKGCSALPGSFIHVKVIEALPFELIAVPLPDQKKINNLKYN